MSDDWVSDESLSAEETMRRFEALNLVPTNDELADRAKGLDAHTVVRNWLDQHPRNVNNPQWSDWAASNFLADPEVGQWITVKRAEGDQ